MIKSWDIFLAIFETYSNYTLINTIHDPSYQRPSYFPIPFATSQEKMRASKIYPTVFPNHRGTATVELSVTARPPAANRARRGCAKATAKTGSGRCNRCRSAPEIFDGKMLKIWHNLNWWFKHTSVFVKTYLKSQLPTKWRSGKCVYKKKSTPEKCLRIDPKVILEGIM